MKPLEGKEIYPDLKLKKSFLNDPHFFLHLIYAYITICYEEMNYVRNVFSRDYIKLKETLK